MGVPTFEAELFWESQCQLGEGTYPHVTSTGLLGTLSQRTIPWRLVSWEEELMIGILWDSDTECLRWVDLKVAEVHSFVLTMERG